MGEPEFEVGLFHVRPEGVSLVGRSRNPDLIDTFRAELAAERRRDLACLEVPRLRLLGASEDEAE